MTIADIKAFGFSDSDAETIIDMYLDSKIISMDHSKGTFNVDHKDYWNRESMLMVLDEHEEYFA